MHHALCLTSWHLSICKIDELQIPAWAEASAFINLALTPTENSLVCEEVCVPRHIKTVEHGWRCLMVEGTMDFSLTGVIAGISDVLAAAQIPIFAISTFDTDYILIKEDRLHNALEALTAQGYNVTTPTQ